MNTSTIPNAINATSGTNDERASFVRSRRVAYPACGVRKLSPGRRVRPIYRRRPSLCTSQGLADGCGVEGLVDQTAAEEEQRPDLNAARGGCGSAGALNGRGVEGHGRVAGAAGGDDGTGVDDDLGHEHVVAGRGLEAAGQAGAARDQPARPHDRDIHLYGGGAERGQVEGDPVAEPAARVLRLGPETRLIDLEHPDRGPLLFVSAARIVLVDGQVTRRSLHI